MSGDVTKDVIARVRAKVDGSVRTAFGEISTGAKGAEAALAGVEQKGKSGLSSLANELRKTDRGFKQLQGGMFGLLASASLLDERFGKGLAIVGVAHSATMSVRGLAGAMPMLSKAASALTSPL